MVWRLVFTAAALALLVFLGGTSTEAPCTGWCAAGGEYNRALTTELDALRTMGDTQREAFVAEARKLGEHHGYQRLRAYAWTSPTAARHFERVRRILGDH